MCCWNFDLYKFDFVFVFDVGNFLKLGSLLFLVIKFRYGKNFNCGFFLVMGFGFINILKGFLFYY